MTTHMIKMSPDLGRMTRWAQERGLIAPYGDDDLSYALHALVVATFGDKAPKPFAFVRRPGSPAAVVGYTTHDAASLRMQVATFAEPDAVEALGADGLSVKAMPEAWPQGLRLGFETTVVPMVRKDRKRLTHILGEREDEGERCLEVDPFLLAPEGSDRGTVYADWLSRHLAAAGGRMVSGRLHAFDFRRGRRRLKDRSFSTKRMPVATFQGTVEVVDPEAFGTLLARGIGRNRAFGYGMVMLRPAA